MLTNIDGVVYPTSLCTFDKDGKAHPPMTEAVAEPVPLTAAAHVPAVHHAPAKKVAAKKAKKK